MNAYQMLIVFGVIMNAEWILLIMNALKTTLEVCLPLFGGIAAMVTLHVLFSFVL